MSTTGFESSSRGGHSADVTIKLILNGHSMPVAQLGPGFLLLDAPTDHPPGLASIALRVDQSEQRWDVRLPNGISACSKRVAIVAARSAPPTRRHETRRGLTLGTPPTLNPQ